MTQVTVSGIDLCELLTLCQNPQRRVEAEKQLEVLQNTQPFQLFPGLAMILAGEDKQPFVRQLAGLVLKNSFAGGRDSSREKQSKERWAAISQSGDSARIIKQAVVSTLTTSKESIARKTAAQVISSIAAIEIPQGGWTDLIDPVLISSVSPEKDGLSKSSALVCLAYMCEEFTGRELEIPQAQVNSMLTAIIQGMKDTDDGVKKEATKALYYAIVLAKTNFGNEPERDVIVSTICDTAKIGLSLPASRTKLEVCAAACECLVQIATEYYVHLAKYMNVIGPLTWEVIKQSSNDHLSMCGIEFWSTVCDEENYIRECVEFDGVDSIHPSSNLAKQALRFLVPILTDVMSRDDNTSDAEDDDDDTWNSGMAAGTCLSLLSQATGDECVDLVLEFVNSHYKSPKPSQREAAMLAYGSIMEGPSLAKMGPLIQMSLNVIVEALNDSVVSVRDNAAWTIGRICQQHTAAIAPAIPNLIPILLTKLSQDKPRVAANVAWIFDVVGQQQSEVRELQLTRDHFTQIVSALLTACTRPDAGAKNLRMTGYAAVASLARNLGTDSVDALVALLDEMCARLESSMSMFGPLFQLPPGSPLPDEMRSAISTLSQSEKDCELQGHICGCIQIVTNRLRDSKFDFTSRAERMMTLYFHVFTLYQRMQSSPVAVHEEALLASSSLALCLGQKFSHFMNSYFPILLAALSNHDQFAVCSMAIGVVGDLSRALDSQMTQFCDRLIKEAFGPLLEMKNVDRKLKPLVMTALGDLALATRGGFEPYVPGTTKLLIQAAYTRLEDGPVDSEEWIDYLNQLRMSVLEGFIGLVYGLREANKHMILKDNVQLILEFIVRLIEDKSVSEDVLRKAMDLVGDLVISYQADLARLLKVAPFMQQLIAFAASSKDSQTQETGKWLARIVDKYNT